MDSVGDEKLIGKVTHFYTNIQVGIIKLEDDVKVGDTIHFKGSTTDFEQTADVLQYGRQAINDGKEGQEIGIKVNERVRVGDLAYKKLF